MQGLGLDLKTALRQLTRAPATALAAIATLAVGIGATSAVFSFVAAVLSATAPVDDMDRLAGVWSHNRTESETKALVSPGDFLEWSARARAFESLVAWEPAGFNLGGAGMPVRVDGQAVTAGYLELLALKPAVGRGFAADDFVPGAPGVLVITDAFWRTTLGAAAGVVGRVVRLDGTPTTIIGVLPELPVLTGIFVPLRLHDRAAVRDTRTLFVWGRLRGGVSLDQARAEMVTIGSELERLYPETNRGWTVNTRPLQEEFVGPQARLVLALMAGAVLAVLLIACVNIANLLLVRGAARAGELAVRVALGAARSRVLRQLLVEASVLALAGAVASIAVSRLTLTFLLATLPMSSPWVANGGVNPRSLLITMAAAVLATLVAGLMPALAAGRVNLVSSLQAAGRSGTGANRRLGRLLAAAQTALAIVLLVAAGLAMRTLIALERLEPGFDTKHVLTASVTLPQAMPPDEAAQWVDRALERARQLPGLISAGATSRLPFAGGRWNPNRGLQIEGRPPDSTQGTWAIDYVITPAFIETMRMTVVEGRSFTRADGASAPPVAIVNQAMARRFWPNASPIGARVRHGNAAAGEWHTIVGVVADVRNDDADQPPVPYLYVPMAQRPVRTMALALRTAGDPRDLAEPLRRAIAELDPDQALYSIRTMEEVWIADLAGSRVLIQVFAALAAIALGLAGLGVAAVAGQSVAQRTREIGVRVALGATSSRVAGLIAWQGLLPVVVGLVIGLAGALGVGQLMRSVLFQVSPTDPVTLGLTMAALAVVAFAATIGPALRAARLDPVVALRNE